jgi:hypothetical protein
LWSGVICPDCITPEDNDEADMETNAKVYALDVLDEVAKDWPDHEGK